MDGVPLFYTGQEIRRQSNVSFFSNSTIDRTTNSDMLATYQNSMNFYKISNVSRKGVLTNYSDTTIICFKKVLHTETVVVLVYTKNAAFTYSVPAEFQNSIWNNTQTSGVQNLVTTLNLNAFG